jgi:hypothetical protein
MAVLDSAARTDAQSKFIQAFFVGLRKTADLSSTEIQTLVNDLDAWLDANTSAANTAITLAVRNKASTDTKFAALAYVALKRSGII